MSAQEECETPPAGGTLLPVPAGIPVFNVRRSLVASVAGTTVGTFLFTLLGGAIFNRYLESVGLKERIGLFLAIPYLAGVVQIFGSWVLQRTGRRRLFFFLFLGPPRLLWLAVVTVPLWGPQGEKARVLVLVCLLLAYWVTAGLGGTAWFSWMRDIIPERIRGRYFAYRSVLCMMVAATWGLAAGYFLERAGLNLAAFGIVYGLGVFFGIADIVLYLWVHHPPMETKRGRERGLVAMMKAAMHPAFTRMVVIQSVLAFASSLGALSAYHFMRGVGMEIFSIQFLGFFWTVVFVVYSLLWGPFLDHYGAKATYVVSFLGSLGLPFAFTLAVYYGPIVFFMTAALGAIAYAGMALASMNLLFTLPRKEDQAMAVAAQSVILGVAAAAGFLVCENLFFPVLRALGGHLGRGPLFYLVFVHVIEGALRIAAFALTLRLPEIEGKPSAWSIAKAFYTTSPLRALHSMGRFFRVKYGDVAKKGGYASLHPSGRWRVG